MKEFQYKLTYLGGSTMKVTFFVEQKKSDLQKKYTEFYGLEVIKVERV